MKTDFERQREWWDAKAEKEENDVGDEPVNRDLRWREIERHLHGVKTILDVGGGAGAFSIPLARRGFEVTHLDLSPSMLELAKRKAGDLPNLRLVQGNAVDLSRFADRSFDMVLNMDGAISFCGDVADQALAETCRVAERTVILGVSNRAWMVWCWLDASLKVHKRITPAVYEMLDRGRWEQGQFPENAAMSRGCAQDYFGDFCAYWPHELRALVESAGFRVLRCGGLGTVANYCGMEMVKQVREEPGTYEEFLNLCERYDHEAAPDGPGTRHRAGLFLVAKREPEAEGAMP